MLATRCHAPIHVCRKTGLGRPPAVSVELSDVTELTNDELMGNQPDQFSPPPEGAQSTARPQFFQPEDEQGSTATSTIFSEHRTFSQPYTDTRAPCGVLLLSAHACRMLVGDW